MLPFFTTGRIKREYWPEMVKEKDKMAGRKQYCF